MTPKKEENIDSLCKKYFTPELCDEPVTESKAKLQNKICEQLIIFGRYLWKQKNYKNIKTLDMIPDPTALIPKDDENDNRPLISSSMEDAIYEAIGILFKNCKKNIPDVSYKSYFSAILNNEFLKKVDEEQISFSGVNPLIKMYKQIKKHAAARNKKIENKSDFFDFCIENEKEYKEEDIKRLMKYVFYDKFLQDEVSFIDNDKDNEYSIFDNMFINWNFQNGSEQEKQVNSTNMIMSILNEINFQYLEEKEDAAFLSIVLTFKILSCFGIRESESSENSNLSEEFYNNLKPILLSFDFSNRKMVEEYFDNGFLPAQKDFERSQGSVNNKWKQFCNKLIKKTMINELR